MLSNLFLLKLSVASGADLQGSSTHSVSWRNSGSERQSVPSQGWDSHLIFPFHIQAPLPCSLLSPQREITAQQSISILLMQLGPQLCIPQQSRGYLRVERCPFPTPHSPFCSPSPSPTTLRHSPSRALLCNVSVGFIPWLVFSGLEPLAHGHAWVPLPVGVSEARWQAKSIRLSAAGVLVQGWRPGAKQSSPASLR